MVGAFLLIANYIVTAALSALSAFQYLGWPYPEVFAACAILLIGAVNFFGTSLSGVANRLVALEEFWTCRAAQLNLEQRASSNPA